MTDFNRAFRTKVLSLSDNVGIFEGSFDPSVTGQAAPEGSLFLRHDGAIWSKTGATDFDWSSSGVATSVLDDMGDVTLTSIMDGDAIIYNISTSQWENTPLQVAGSGRIVQLQFGPISAQLGTASIPKDTTSPLITEGVEIWSQVFTPTATTSIMRVSSSFSVTASNSSQEIIFAIFRDSTCIGVATDAVANKDEAQSVTYTFYDDPATTSTLTYSVRAGKIAGDAGTWYVNTLPGFTPGTEYGGVLTNNAYTVEEIANA